jgi:hypothetical protein
MWSTTGAGERTVFIDDCSTANMSRTDILEQKLTIKLNMSTVRTAFNAYKAVWHWRHGLVRSVFCALRRWAASRAVLRSPHESPVRAAVLPKVVDSHTVSSIAKFQSSAGNMPGRHYKKATQFTTPNGKWVTAPLDRTPASRGKGSQTQRVRLVSVRYVRNKYYSPSKPSHPGIAPARSLSTTVGATVPAVIPLRSLASHPLYMQISATAEAAGLRVPLSGGAPLAKSSLYLPLSQSVVQAPQISPTRPTDSQPKAYDHGVAAASPVFVPTTTLSPSRQRPLTQQERAVAAPREEDRSQDGPTCSGVAQRPAGSPVSPAPVTAAELAYARSRGSYPQLDDVQAQRSADRGFAPREQAVSQPATGRGGRLQAMLRNHGLASSHTAGHTERATLAIEIPISPPSCQTPEDVHAAQGPRLPLLACALRRLYRCTLRLQERRTAALEAAIGASYRYAGYGLHGALVRLYKHSKSPLHATQRALIEVAADTWRQGVLFKAFSALKERAVHASGRQHLHARGTRYHRLLSLSRGFSALEGASDLVRLRSARQAASLTSSPRHEEAPSGVQAGTAPIGGYQMGLQNDSSCSSLCSSISTDSVGSAPSCEGDDANMTAALLTPVSQRSGSPDASSALGVEQEPDLELSAVRYAVSGESYGSERGAGSAELLQLLQHEHSPPGEGVEPVARMRVQGAHHAGSGNSSPDPEPRPRLEKSAAAATSVGYDGMVHSLGGDQDRTTGDVPGTSSAESHAAGAAVDDESADLSLYLSSDSDLSYVAGVPGMELVWTGLNVVVPAPPPLPSPCASPLPDALRSDVLREAVAYHRRTLLLQGLYGLSQWALRSQSAASMSAVLEQYRTTRLQRMALGCLRMNALL